MVGANYMGGKRNTARAKSKDVVGRAQRRHFGKQRLASALCSTQEDRVRPSLSTRSSVLPDITLAHARYHHASTDSGVTSRNVISGDRLYSPTPSSDTTHRNRPSKVLGALDASDHISIRAAIKRILQQPNLIGISITNPKVTARTQTPALARRPTEALLDSEDSGIQYSEIVYSPIQRHQPAESSLNTRYGPTESGILSPPDSPSRTWDATSHVAFDDTEAQSFTGAACTGTEGPEWPDTSLGVVHLLPRSSPFPSSSQSSDNSILDLDTSRRASVRFGRLDYLSKENVDCVDASSLRSDHQPTFRPPSRSFPIREGSAGPNEAQFTSSSPTSSIEKKIATEQSRTTCFPSTGHNDSRHLSPSGSGHNSVRNTMNQEVTENAPSDIPIDFLSDPHPWETIGRILKLKPPRACAVQSVTINFTKDREGVGYVSPEKSGTCDARPSDASFETRIDDTPADDTHGTSDVEPPILDSEVSIVDSRITIDTPDSPCTSNSTWPLLDEGPPFTAPAEVPAHVHVHPPQEAPSILGTHCTQNEHTRPSPPLANIVGATAPEPDVDVTFDGPCLFGDSDLEEDE